jgi:hypothetical protein
MHIKVKRLTSKANLGAVGCAKRGPISGCPEKKGKDGAHPVHVLVAGRHGVAGEEGDLPKRPQVLWPDQQRHHARPRRIRL